MTLKTRVLIMMQNKTIIAGIVASALSITAHAQTPIKKITNSQSTPISQLIAKQQ